MVRQKKILFVLCTHSLIVIVVHAQSVMTLGLGGGSIVFPETIYNRNDVILKETPYFSPEGMLDFYFENKIIYHHLILRGGYNQLARNSVSIPEHETPGGAIREWPYYGKDRPAQSPYARFGYSYGKILDSFKLGIGMGAKVSTNSWNGNFRNTMGYPDWYVQIVDVPNEDTWQIFTIVECTYNFNWAGKPWVLNSQFTPSIYNRMKQQITLSNLATIDPINIERKINQPILHISIGIEL